MAASRRTGRLIHWNDDRGFGFIEDGDFPDNVWVHIKAFPPTGRRPAKGDTVSYRLVDGRDGRPAAADARLVGKGISFAPEDRAPFRLTIRIVTALMLATSVVAAIVTVRAPLWLAGLSFGMGIVSFVFYRSDKRAAEAGAWRAREASLHLVDLLFGIWGGLVAQGVLRHKSSKLGFGVVTTLIVLVHAALVVALLLGVVRLG